MTHTEGTFTGINGFTLYYQRWSPPEETPKAALVVAHGLAEHSGRYQNVVSYFVPRGYEVWAFDYEGHGKSGGRRGYVNRFAAYVQDLEAFLQIVSQNRKYSPVFLIGHSMGAPVAVLAALNHQRELKGLILSGPLLEGSMSVSRPLRAAAGLLSCLTPKIGLTIIEAAKISRDEKVVSSYDSDPLVYRGKISARLGTEVIKAVETISRKASSLTLPLLIVQGGADTLCLPEGGATIYRLAGSQDKTRKVYEGFYHEVFNELGREQVLGDIEQWVRAHLI